MFLSLVSSLIKLHFNLSCYFKTCENSNLEKLLQLIFYSHMHRISSCSDTQLNIWPPTWSHSSSTTQLASSSVQEDARRKLHYHLSAIFPEEQVTQAMQMYPDETNPQNICAAILSMFPKTWEWKQNRRYRKGN